MEIGDAIAIELLNNAKLIFPPDRNSSLFYDIPHGYKKHLRTGCFLQLVFALPLTMSYAIFEY